MLCRQLLLDLYAPLKGIEDRTIELYGFTLDAYSESLGHECAVEDFDELLVARFLAARKRTHAAATVAKDRSQLRALWEFAARRGLCDEECRFGVGGDLAVPILFGKIHEIAHEDDARVAERDIEAFEF